MTQPFEDAVEAVRRLSPETQDAIAAILRNITDGPEEEGSIPAAHLPAVVEGLAQLDREEFSEGTPSDLVRATFRRA